VSSIISKGFNSAIIQSVADAVHVNPPDVSIMKLIYVGTRKGWATVTYGISTTAFTPSTLTTVITAPGTSDIIVTDMSNNGYYVTLSRPNVTDISPTLSPSAVPTLQPIALPPGPMSGVIVGGLVFLFMITAGVCFIYWRYYAAAPSGPEKGIQKDVDGVGLAGPLAMDEDI
jgi:hypothetical protein